MESIYSHHYRHTELVHILDMSFQVYDTLFESLNIFVSKLSFRNTAIVFQCPYSSHQNYATWFKTSVSALDIKEFLSAKVRAEAGLSDSVVSKLQSKLCGSY